MAKLSRMVTQSTLAQLLACCLMLPNHHLYHCCLIFKAVLWHLPENILAESAHELNPQHLFKGYTSKITTTSLRGPMNYICFGNGKYSTFQATCTPHMVHYLLCFVVYRHWMILPQSFRVTSLAVRQSRLSQCQKINPEGYGWMSHRNLSITACMKYRSISLSFHTMYWLLWISSGIPRYS